MVNRQTVGNLHNNHPAYGQPMTYGRPTEPSSRRIADSRTRWVNIVWFVYGFIAILLAMQFTMKLLAANPENDFVSFIYSFSEIFSAPFDTMFNVRDLPAGNVNSVFVPSILVAIGFYGLLAWGLTKLIYLNRTYEA